MCCAFRPRANIGYCKLIVTRFVNCVCLGISSSTVIRLDVTNSVPWEDWACKSSEDDEFSPISTFLVFISSMIILSFFYSFSQVCKANMESIWHANVCAHSCAYPSFAIFVVSLISREFSRLYLTSVSRNEKTRLKWYPCESRYSSVPTLIECVSR